MLNLKEFKLTIYDTPAIGWGIFILVMSLLPGRDIPDALLKMNDKVIHFSIYFIFASLLVLGQRRFKSRMTLSREWVTRMLFSILFGGAIELIQGSIDTHRSPEWGDMLANTLGVIAGFSIFFIGQSPFAKKTE